MMLNQYTLYLACIIAGWSLNANATTCKAVEQLSEGHFDRGGYIKKLGGYCLTYDIYQPKPSKLIWESVSNFSGNLLTVDICSKKEGNCDEYLLKTSKYLISDVDLQQHILSGSPENTVGIKSFSSTYQHLESTTIKNGFIKVPYIGVLLEFGFEVVGEFPFVSDLNGPGKIKQIIRVISEDEPATALINHPNFYVADPTAPLFNYQNTHVNIQELNIQAGYRGIVLGGGNNTIRNSTIEVDGHTSIYMYGPNPVIENNTIIIHGKGETNPNFKNDGIKILDGAIKLRDAKGGIIRNNRIIYKGGLFSFGKAPAAINLLDSKDVLIENNTIEGFKSLVRKNGDTSFDEKSNTLK